MQHVADPKAAISDSIKDYVTGLEPLGSQVLVGIYVRPNKTAGGIFLTDKHRAEDTYQGKVGLVLKLGALAFVDDDSHKFGKVVPKVGDWVLFRVGDTFPFVLGDRDCRFIEDVHIHAILTRPDIAL